MHNGSTNGNSNGTANKGGNTKSKNGDGDGRSSSRGGGGGGGGGGGPGTASLTVTTSGAGAGAADRSSSRLPDVVDIPPHEAAAAAAPVTPQPPSPPSPPTVPSSAVEFEDVREDEILDLDKELEAAIEQSRASGRGDDTLGDSTSEGGVKFRTLSTSSSEEDGASLGAMMKHKFKKTPLPKRKQRKKKQPAAISPGGKTREAVPPPIRRRSSDDDFEQQQQQQQQQRRSRVPVPQARLGPDAEESKEEVGGAGAEDLKRLSNSNKGKIVSTSVTHKEIQKFLHKSKMEMEVGDVRRAFANARSFMDKGLAESFRESEGLDSGAGFTTMSMGGGTMGDQDSDDDNMEQRQQQDVRASGAKAGANASKSRATTKPEDRSRQKSQSPSRVPRRVPTTTMKGSSSVPERLQQKQQHETDDGRESGREAKTQSRAAGEGAMQKPKSLSSINTTTLSKPTRGKKPPPEVKEDVEAIKVGKQRVRSKSPAAAITEKNPDAKPMKLKPVRGKPKRRSTPPKEEEDNGGGRRTSTLPPVSKAGPPKPKTNSAEDSAKRLELIKAARSSKRKVDPAHFKQRDKEQEEPPSPTSRAAPATKALGGGGKQPRAALPLVVKPEPGGAKKKKRDAAVYADANEDFYREFKIIYVALPVPKDDLPRKYECRSYGRGCASPYRSEMSLLRR